MFEITGVLSLIVAGSTLERVPATRPTVQQAVWQDLEYGMFIHYGLYAYTGVFTGILWVPDGANPLYSSSLDPVDPAVFNPTDLDAEQWVATAKGAGMKYLMLTAKHHDGFCLWPTATCEHSVKHSPWRGGKGDVVREVAEACHAHGIGFGFYLSPWDAYAYQTLKLSDAAYDEYYQQQMTELLTDYGEVMEVWWDGAGAYMRQHDWGGYYRLVKSLQPNALVAISGSSDVRWFWEMPGEQGLAPDPNWYVIHVSENLEEGVFRSWPTELLGQDYWWPGEAYAPIDRFWSGETGLPFGHSEDTVRSLDELLSMYHGSVGHGANLVVNFVPEPSGRLSAGQMERIREVGEVLSRIYAENLLRGGRATASTAGEGEQHSPARAIDGDPDTWWQAADGATEAWLEVDLGRPVTFDRAVMQEVIVAGQSVQSYHLLWWDDQEWRTASVGRGASSIGTENPVKDFITHSPRGSLMVSIVRWQPSLVR